MVADRGKEKLTAAEFDAAFASFDQAQMTDEVDELQQAFHRQSLEEKGKGRAIDDEYQRDER